MEELTEREALEILRRAEEVGRSYCKANKGILFEDLKARVEAAFPEDGPRSDVYRIVTSYLSGLMFSAYIEAMFRSLADAGMGIDMTAFDELVDRFRAECYARFTKRLGDTLPK